MSFPDVGQIKLMGRMALRKGKVGFQSGSVPLVQRPRPTDDGAGG